MNENDDSSTIDSASIAKRRVRGSMARGAVLVVWRPVCTSRLITDRRAQESTSPAVLESRLPTLLLGENALGHASIATTLPNMGRAGLSDANQFEK